MTVATHSPTSSVRAADPILADLVEQFLERLQAGEVLDPTGFAAAHPEHAEPLRQLLPALEMMAALSHSAARAGRGAAAPADIAGPGLGVLGDFHIVREVGRGGMGIVYEAEQLSLRRRVALKVLPFAAALDPRQLARFKSEAQATALLHHTNIVPVHAVGAERGVHYYAMQFIDGRTLADVISELRHLEGKTSEGMKDESGRMKTENTAAAAAADLSGSSFIPHPSSLPDGRKAEGERMNKTDSGSSFILHPSSFPPENTAGADRSGSSFIPHPSSLPEGRKAEGGRMNKTDSGSSFIPHPSSFPNTSTRNRAYFRNVARLGLEAAEAIEHAHQEEIVHRDIKPANLMVDAKGHLWVTDFGLARLKSDSGLTVSGDLLGTLRYMSPEQASGKRVVIDGRTDIYSLGVTLYELVTLEPVFDGADRQELLRRIAEQDPRPPRKLDASIPRDLETVLLKAIAKEPDGRYQTAQELADDLRRFLDEKPIRAKRPTAWEQIRKWSRRHKPAVGSAVAVLVLAVVSLAVAIAAISRERDEARRQRRRAEENFAKAHEAVNEYLTKVSEERLLDQPGMQPLRKELLEAALKYYRGFLWEHRDNPALQAEVAETSLRVGRVVEMIGLKPDALASYQVALANYRKLAQAHPDRTELQDGMATSLIQVGDLQYRTGSTTSAMASFREAIATLDWLVQSYPEIHRFQEGLAKSHHLLGDLQYHFNAFEDARKSYLRAIELWERLAAADPSVAGYQYGLARSLTLLGWNSPPPEADRHHQRAYEIYRRLVAAHPADTEYQNYLAGSYSDLGGLHFQAGRLEAAEPLYQHSLDLHRRLAAANPEVRKFRLNVAIDEEVLGMLRHATGDFDVAEQFIRDSISIMTELVEADPTLASYRDKLIEACIELGDLERSACDPKAARRAYEHARDVATRLVAADPSARHQGKLAQAFIRLGCLHLAEGDCEAARGCFQPDLALKTVPTEACLAVVRESPETRLGMGKLEANAGHCTAAAQFYERAIAIWAREYEARPTETAARDNLARVYLELGQLKRAANDPSGARLAYEQALALRQKLTNDAPAHFLFARDLGLSYVAVGHFCYDQGQFEAARGWYEKAELTYRGFLKRKPDNPVMCHELAWLLATCRDPRLRDPAEALVLAKTAADQSPGIGTFARTLGLAHYREGHWDEAIAALQKATQLRAGDPAAWLLLAMAQWHKGDRDQARKRYDQAVTWIEKHIPQNGDLLRLRAEAAALLVAGEDTKPAGKEANTTQESTP